MKNLVIYQCIQLVHEMPCYLT